MALKRLRQSILDEFPTVDQEGDSTSTVTLMAFIDSYIDKEEAEYKKNKENNLITWGKYKGYSVKELALTDKGKSYLEWTLSQTWVSPDKFGWFIDECKALKIVKKNSRRTPLE